MTDSAQMNRCPRCGRTYEAALGFCQVDGTPLVPTVPLASRPPVGAPPPLPSAPAPPPGAKPVEGPNASARSHASPLVLALGAGLVLVATAFGAYVFVTRPDAHPSATTTAAATAAAETAARIADSVATARLSVPAEGADAFVDDGDGDAFAEAIATPPGMHEVREVRTVHEPQDGWLNLRDGPNARAGIVTRMDNGVQVFVHYCRPNVVQSRSGPPGRWCYLDAQGRTGWAFDAYLVAP